VTHFIAALGTSGSFTGTARRLKRDIPNVTCISAQPSSGFHGLEGLKHMPTAIVPGIYDPHLADHNIWIETEDAYAMTRRVGRAEGILIGISAGANLVAARNVGAELVKEGKPGVIVTFLCDSAAKYLSEPFWDE
jgi:cysteine synthase B